MDTLTLGVVSDTHVPDRASGLHPLLLDCFREEKVTAILHAGDVCVPAVLAELAKIAPVHAVQGNRDIFYLRSLPSSLILNFNGISIGLVHGHGRLHQYILDRLRYYLGGLKLTRYRMRAAQSFPHCRVVVFGHIHHPIQHWMENQYLFNPGSACCPDNIKGPPSAGLLYLHSDGTVESKIFSLE